jgi:uncharacterized protein
MHIVVLHLSEEEKKNLGIFSWPIESINASIFAWHHKSKEECYFLEGDVEMITSDGKKTTFGTGDYVVLPKGLSCICNIKKPVRKHTRTE